MSYLARVEYWTPTGWWIAHAGIALLDPAAYVVKLQRRGVVSRVSTLDDRLQPDEVFMTPGADLL